MGYKSLRITSYEDHEGIKAEYQRRLSNPAAIRTRLRISPYSIQQQKRLTEVQYDLFCILLPEIVRMKDDIFLNSLSITKALEKLPGIARKYFIATQLIEEIQSTNEIEGLHSTRKEIARALDKKTGVRFTGVVNKYNQIIEQKMNQIEHPAEIREIYNSLVSEEIKKEDQPDGELFRTELVFISEGDRQVHQGDPDELTIREHLEDLIAFMNDPGVPITIKAIISHYYFEYIHPFYDGNGRMGRFIFSAYISRKLDALTGLSISTGIIRNKKIYEEVFIETSHVKNKGEVTFFVRDLMKIIISSQEYVIDAISVAQKRLENALHFLDQGDYEPDEEKVLFIMFQDRIFNPYSDLSNSDIAEATKLSRFKVDNAMRQLEEQGLTKKVRKSPVTFELTNMLSHLLE